MFSGYAPTDADKAKMEAHVSNQNEQQATDPTAFQGGNEQHNVWVEENNVVVASTPMVLSKQIDEQLKDLPEDVQDVRLPNPEE